MRPTGRIVGLGEPAAGDDGVGIAVLDWLRERGVPAGIALAEVRDASGLLPLLESPGRVVLVDAAIGGAPGRVVELAPAELDCSHLLPLSTHGVGVAQMIALAAMLTPDRLAPSIRIVAITIAKPRTYLKALSAAVNAAVPRAAACAVELAASTDDTG